jgi:hypothetical protein
MHSTDRPSDVTSWFKRSLTRLARYLAKLRTDDWVSHIVRSKWSTWIVMYHRYHGQWRYGWSTRRGQCVIFKPRINYIKKRGYTVSTVAGWKQVHHREIERRDNSHILNSMTIEYWQFFSTTRRTFCDNHDAHLICKRVCAHEWAILSTQQLKIDSSVSRPTISTAHHDHTNMYVFVDVDVSI